MGVCLSMYIVQPLYVNGYTKYFMYSSSVKTQNPILKWDPDIVVEQMPPRGLYLAPAAFTNTPLMQCIFCCFGQVVQLFLDVKNNV